MNAPSVAAPKPSVRNAGTQCRHPMRSPAITTPATAFTMNMGPHRLVANPVEPQNEQVHGRRNHQSERTRDVKSHADTPVVPVAPQVMGHRGVGPLDTKTSEAAGPGSGRGGGPLGDGPKAVRNRSRNASIGQTGACGAGAQAGLPAPAGDPVQHRRVVGDDRDRHVVARASVR